MPTGINNFKVLKNERRHHNNIGVDSHLCNTSSAPLLNPQYVAPLNPGSIIPGERGSRHFEPTYSQAKEWKVAMRQSAMSRAYGSEAEERGKGVVAPPPKGKEDQLPHQRRHDIPLPDGSLSAFRKGQETNGLCVGFKSLKHFDKKAGGGTIEYDMETYMNKKQRAGETINRMRNNIPVAVPGDRPYKVVEHEPGYFAKGGLIPGSSIQMRKSAKPERRNNSGDGDGDGNTNNPHTEKKRLTYHEKQKLLNDKYDLEQVRCLTESSEKQGNEIPSFETRTGAYLVKPEDEAY